MGKRFASWLDERLSISAVIRHPVPKNVNWWYVFGSSTLVIFVLQVTTGLLLAFTYVPSTEHARDSLLFITNQATFGGFLRGMHFWGASAMVVLITVHAARVALTGSYKFPREMNWLVGVVLLFLTLAMAFSGQLLRWDQDAYWSTVVGAEQAGRIPFIGKWIVQLFLAGNTVGAETLTRFYATHIFLIPVSIALLITIHLYLVIQHGISEPPRAGVPVNPATYRAEYESLLKKHGVPFWPDVAWRDVVFGLAVVLVVVLLAVFAGPRVIGPPVDPAQTVTYPRPDWYFLWYFAVLALLPRSVETLVIIGFPLLVIIGLIAVPLIGSRGERSPKRRPWALAIIGVAAISVLNLQLLGNAEPWAPVLETTPIPASITRSMSSDAQRGARLFDSYACLSCHTVAGTGGSRGPNLTHVEDRLSSGQMTWRILNGGQNMPAYGTTLNQTDLAALIAFLQSQKSP